MLFNLYDKDYMFVMRNICGAEAIANVAKISHRQN